jgi:hypothetical protein
MQTQRLLPPASAVRGTASALSRAFAPVVAIALSLAASSCNLLDPPPVTITKGTYEGDFSVTRDSAGNVVSIVNTPVRVTFDGKAYTVVVLSNNNRRDALPNTQTSGSYTLAYRSITFTDRTERGSASPLPSSVTLNANFTYTFDGMNLVADRKEARASDGTQRTENLFVLRAR